MEKNAKIILVGFMGAGKTYLGKELAKQLKVPFIDSDKEIEKEYKKSINQMFESEGEEAFRLKEQNFLKGLNDKKSFVLATGGGMPCYSVNMDLLNNLGVTVYIRLSTKVLAKRLLKDSENRPLIIDNQLEQLQSFIKEKLAVREQFYNNAHIVLEEKDQTVDSLLKLLKDE